eukprot:6180502-Pleurochrysis_carterae.AAC.1
MKDSREKIRFCIAKLSFKPGTVFVPQGKNTHGRFMTNNFFADANEETIFAAVPHKLAPLQRSPAAKQPKLRNQKQPKLRNHSQSVPIDSS